MHNKSLKVKVCGMKTALNIADIASLKPDYMGFIFYEKSPRFVSTISSELIKYVPQEIKTVGVFVNEELDRIKLKIATLGLKAVQLHGNEDPQFCRDLREAFPYVEIIKAFGIDQDFDFSVLDSYKNEVDFFLFDTKTSIYGGSGKHFDWEILKQYKLTTPYFLSGGIDMPSVIDILAIDDERFVAVDINSKFEIKPGLKDEVEVGKFINAIREAV